MFLTTRTPTGSQSSRYKNGSRRSFTFVISNKNEQGLIEFRLACVLSVCQQRPLLKTSLADSTLICIILDITNHALDQLFEIIF